MNNFKSRSRKRGSPGAAGPRGVDLQIFGTKARRSPKRKSSASPKRKASASPDSRVSSGTGRSAKRSLDVQKEVPSVQHSSVPHPVQNGNDSN